MMVMARDVVVVEWAHVLRIEARRRRDNRTLDTVKRGENREHGRRGVVLAIFKTVMVAQSNLCQLGLQSLREERTYW